MAAANDAIASLTPSERVILGWIAEYLAAGPMGGVRQTIYAGYRVLTGEGQLLEGLELEHEDEKQSARLLLNTLATYGEEETVLSDFADDDPDANPDHDLTSWEILEDEDMPAAWDRSASSEFFKLCLELRTQAVLRHCNIEDGSFDVDAAGWSARLRSAFEPLQGSDNETNAKNKLLKKRREQLEAYIKPSKKAALKQFAVNHLRSDAKEQLHAALQTLTEQFPPTFLEQVEANRDTVGAATAAQATATAPAQGAGSTPVGVTRSAAKNPAASPGQADEEVLEEQEELVDDGGSDDSPALPRRRRQRRQRRDPEKSAAAPSAAAAEPSPARNLRRSARKAARSGSDASAEKLSAATVASAGLPSRAIGLNELRDASGLGPTEFLQVWNQQHPEVRSWLDMVDGENDAGSSQKSNSADTQSVDDVDAKEEVADESQQDALSDASNRPKQLRDLKAESARLKTLGGDDPLAASLAAGPSVDNGFGFAAPPSRRTRAAAAAANGSADKNDRRARGRFDRSPLFNKPTANAVKHTWDEDEDDIEDDADDENDAKDPYDYDADQSVAARLDSPRAGKLAPLNNRQQQQLPTSRRGTASAASSASKKRALPSSSRKAQQGSGGGGARNNRKKYRRWTDEETENLRKGVDRWGTKWAKILQSYDFNERTGVDLKDRWRNLSKNA